MTDRTLARMRAERRAAERAELLDTAWDAVAIGAPVLALWAFCWLFGWLMASGALPC